MCDRLQELEAEISLLAEQAEDLTGENEALKTEARLQDEQLQQLSTPSVDYRQLHDRIQELESELAQLRATTTTPQTWSKEQLQVLRDRILKNWRVALGSEKKERIKEALDRFIAEISGVLKKGQPEVAPSQDSIPLSIPATNTPESQAKNNDRTIIRET